MSAAKGILKGSMAAALVLAIAVCTEASDGRTPIGSVPYTISSSGDYYLTADLTYTGTSPITISASGVNLDLNGHTVSAGGSSYYCVSANGYTNIKVSNGSLAGGAAGLFAGTVNGGVISAENLTITGFSSVGIVVGGGSPQPEVFIVGNRITCNGAAGADGIDLTSVWGGRVASNILVGKSPVTGGWGISLTTSTSLWIAENTVTFFWQGIGVNSGTAVSIVRNNSSHNSYGVVVQSAATALDLEENFMASNTTAGFEMSAVSPTIIYRNNTAQSNGTNYAISGATNGGGNL